MRKEILKRLFRERHASLSLSINAIVVLIMAITMLGLGLAFMKGVFSKADSATEGATKEIEKQAVESLKTSGKKTALSQNSIELKPKEKKGAIIAVTNKVDTAKEYKVVYQYLGCTGEYTCTAGSPVDPDLNSGSLKIKTVATFGMILPDDAQTVPFNVETTSGSKDGTVTIQLLVYQDTVDPVNLYGTETITISTSSK